MLYFDRCLVICATFRRKITEPVTDDKHLPTEKMLSTGDVHDVYQIILSVSHALSMHFVYVVVVVVRTNETDT